MGRRRTLWLGLGALAVALVALVEVRVTRPPVAVRWRAGITDADRAAAEARYSLRAGERDRDARETMTWRYELADRSRDNLRALIDDPAVEDTAYVDRDTLTTPGAAVSVGLRAWAPPSPDALPFPFGARERTFEDPSRLFQPQSLWLLLAGGAALLAAGVSDGRRRRNVTIAALLGTGVATVASPINPDYVRLAPGNPRAESRQNFESYYGGRVRFEKHLSQVLLLRMYEGDSAPDAPARALTAMARLAGAWFVVTALAVGYLERWSPVVVRYLALVLLAPAALLYFGWLEFAYLGLTAAAFPLLARGVNDGGARLEAGSAVAGFGAALHGVGLVSIAGAILAALATATARVTERLSRTLRVVIWCTAAYLGWVAIYVIVLKLPIDPGNPGPGWRMLREPFVWEGRVSAPILSAIGLRDIAMSGWVAGAPLLVVAVSLWRRCGQEVRTALLYAVPSILFLVWRWPQDGVGQCVDLVVAGFPAVYALAWVCAHDRRRTLVAAACLASAHLAFWRVLLDGQFDVVRIS